MPPTTPGKAIHPTTAQLAEYLSGTLSASEHETLTDHIGSCKECMAAIAAAHEAVSADTTAKPVPGTKPAATWPSLYLIGAIAAFILSFLLPRYFVQFLVATLVLSLKWIVDARSTRMLVMIYEAWKKGGEKEASKILETFDQLSKKRF